MGDNHNSLFFLLCFCLLMGLATSSSFISYQALETHGQSGRNLLQLKKPCNVSFENMDYSIITKKCKGPTYPADQCCSALKEFACPMREAINDMESDCASTMFSYINLYGKYPPGLFANECKEGKNGLDCEQSDKNQSSSGVDVTTATPSSSLLMLATVILVLFVQIF